MMGQPDPKPAIIGGVFGFPTWEPRPAGPQAATPLAEWDRGRWVASARCGLYLFATGARPARVWLPSFLCATVLEPFRLAQVPWQFYPVDDHLRASDQKWVAAVGPEDAVVIIDYFGFSPSPDLAERVRRRGAWVIRDASQALLSRPAGPEVEVAVFSFRKFVGVPDGGLVMVSADGEVRARACGATFLSLPLAACPPEWWGTSFSAVLKRREADLFGARNDWFPTFQASQALAPCGAYAASELSRQWLAAAFDYDAIRLVRRRNYCRLLERLAPLALFPELPAEVVPLGFPIRVANREAVREALFREQIFPPVHWPLAGVVPPEFGASHALAREIMTLVCDQRYDEADMARTADVVLQALR